MAWKDACQGGRGRANAVLALGLDELKDVYRSISDRQARWANTCWEISARWKRARPPGGGRQTQISAHQGLTTGT
jgi:hypothetical protein